MTARIANEYGNINIYEQVIGSIAGIATMECYGVVGMVSKGAKDGLSELLLREHLTKGVKVESNGEEVKIDLYVVIQYGISISTVANNIIEKVKYNIEKYTELDVKKVIVNIQDIRIQK